MSPTMIGSNSKDGSSRRVVARIASAACALAVAVGVVVVLTDRPGQAAERNAVPPAAPDAHAGHGGGEKRAADLGVVSLDVCVDGGRVHLLTARRDAAGAAARLEYRCSTDGGRTWCSPVIVGDGQTPPGPVKRGADAQVVARGDKLFAAWTTAGALDRMGRGPIETAVSGDGGRTWRAGPNPSDSGAAIGHAFLDVAADERGTFHLVWLDGRDQPVPSATPGKDEKRDPNAPSPGKGLRYARSTDGGATWSKNVTLVGKTCECCWNTVAVAPGGRVAVMYRGHAPRDMAVIASDDFGDTWGTPTVVGDFKWDVNACPHVGGGLTFGPTARDAFATVWTAGGGKGGTGAFFLRCGDGGKEWSAPAQLAGDPATWRTDVAAGPDGALAVAYDAYAGTAAAVFAMTSPDGGKTWSTPERLSAPGASATHPRVVRTAEGFRAFWTAKPAADAPGTWDSAPVPPVAKASK